MPLAITHGTAFPICIYVFKYAPKNKYKPQKQNFNHYVDNEKSIFLKELNFD